MVRGLELGSGGHFTDDLLLGWTGCRRSIAAPTASTSPRSSPDQTSRFPIAHGRALERPAPVGGSLERGSYLGGSFEVAPVADDRPLPVGAFVEVPVAGERVAWAEVVHREGRDPVNVDRLGIVAPVASGARLGMLRDRKEVRVREALVLDYEAFGDLGEVDADDFERAARRGGSTGDRHLERDVCYPPEDAGADSLTLCARFVFGRYGGVLFDELLRNHGAGVGPDERWDLLLTSLATVEDLARGAARLRSFGSYHLDAAAYRARLARPEGTPSSGRTPSATSSGPSSSPRTRLGPRAGSRDGSPWSLPPTAAPGPSCASTSSGGPGRISMGSPRRRSGC